MLFNAFSMPKYRAGYLDFTPSRKKGFQTQIVGVTWNVGNVRGIFYIDDETPCYPLWTVKMRSHAKRSRKSS